MGDSTHMVDVGMSEQNRMIANRLAMPSANIKTDSPAWQLNARLQARDRHGTDRNPGKLEHIRHFIDSYNT